MNNRVSESSSWADRFQQQFDALTPLILSEWHQLDADTLSYTEGDLDLVVDYIATQTDHTRTLVRHHLGELYALCQRAEDSAQTLKTAKPTLEAATNNAGSDPVERTLKALERRAERLLTRVEANLLPEVRSDRDREKLNTSLVTAFGIGLVVGMILGGWGRGRR